MSKPYHGYNLSKLKAESQYTKFVFTGFIFKQVCLNLLSIITKILSLLLHRFAIEDYFHKIYLGITTVTPIFNLPKSKTIITFIRNLFTYWKLKLSVLPVWGSAQHLLQVILYIYWSWKRAWIYIYQSYSYYWQRLFTKPLFLKH